MDPQRGIEHARCGHCHAPLALGRASASSAPAEPIVVTDADFYERVINSRLPVLVDFWAPWCGPCRQVAPLLEDLAREYRGRVIVAKLNVDENGYTAREFRVSSIPTLVLIRGGNEVNRLIGAQSRPYIERLLSMVV
ncbi:MAG: thioredoxin [Leptospirillia bacterium]